VIPRLSRSLFTHCYCHPQLYLSPVAFLIAPDRPHLCLPDNHPGSHVTSVSVIHPLYHQSIVIHPLFPIRSVLPHHSPPPPYPGSIAPSTISPVRALLLYPLLPCPGITALSITPLSGHYCSIHYSPVRALLLYPLFPCPGIIALSIIPLSGHYCSIHYSLFLGNIAPSIIPSVQALSPFSCDSLFGHYNLPSLFLTRTLLSFFIIRALLPPHITLLSGH
jgi:hypothetical protein